MVTPATGAITALMLALATLGGRKPWTPTPEMIARLEAKVSLTQGVGHDGRRTYWGDYYHEHKALVGLYDALDDRGGITILKAGEPHPKVADEGCRTVMVWYDLETDQILHLGCGPPA
jgi:hypothetical protein